MKKYVVVEVCERDIATPRVYDTWEEANKDLCDCFAQVMGYEDADDQGFKDFIQPYIDESGDSMDIGDYDEGWGLGPNMAYAESKNHDNWDIEIFEVDMDKIDDDDDEDEEDEEYVAWHEESHPTCSDIPDDECNGHCMSCAYRPE